MSTLPEKLDKQFAYQRALHATSGSMDDLFVEVNHLARYLAEQTRQELPRLRRLMKAELERRVEAGEIRRWTDVCGPSRLGARADQGA